MAERHVILIDDARHFTGKGDYPGIPFLKDLASGAGFNHFEVKDDILCFYQQDEGPL
jgi:hypothetical protein